MENKIIKYASQGFSNMNVYGFACMFFNKKDNKTIEKISEAKTNFFSLIIRIQ